MKITITKDDLKTSVEKGIISDEQATNLWFHFSEKTQPKIMFSGLNVTYYFGALIIISACISLVATLLSAQMLHTIHTLFKYM